MADQPATAGVSMEVDGQASTAPTSMGAACEQAAVSAVVQREQEARKVGM